MKVFLILLLLLLPNFALAAWWNPLSWFSDTSEVQQVQQANVSQALRCEPEIIEKIVEVPVEKIVIEYIEVPVEKVVIKIEYIEVEKIVEVIKEVPVEKIVYQEIVREVYLPRQCPQVQVCPQSFVDPQLRNQYLQDLETINQQIIDLTIATNEEIEKAKQQRVSTRIIDLDIQAIRSRVASTFEELYFFRQMALDWLNTH